jgi:pimeloyl-ACP methyl ester carboxylesterase
MPAAHRIPVTDEESVAAVVHDAPGDDWLFFCHGLRSDKSGSYEGRCARAVDAGYTAVRFDVRGCGESDGAFVDATLSARLADLRAVLDYFDPSDYALFGSSFGGTVAFHAAAADDRVTALAARAPATFASAFDDYRAAVARDGHYEFDTGERIDARFFEDLDDHPFDAVVDALDVPVAIFHGATDESVPVADSFEAAQRLQTDVLLEKFAGEGHRFSRAAEDRLRARLFDWLAN